ncbi:MAG: hypothetical protein ACOCSL_05150, partial [Thermoplasmatota archaeon]
AYQVLGKIHPVLDRPVPKSDLSEKDDFDIIDEMESLVRKQHDLKKKIKEAKKKEFKENKIKKLEKDLEATVDKLKELEKKRAEQLEEDD